MTSINQQKLAETFMELVKIDSPSKEEKVFSQYLKKLFKDELGFSVNEDSSHEKTGCNCGNLYVNLDGDPALTPLFFNAHMDTVEPGRNIKPIFQNSIIKSDGTTILGADDKAAIAVLIEVARYLKENSIKHCPLEFIFTTGEEVGLLGAKEVNPSLIKARNGYALDATDPLTLITHAPSAIRFKVTIKGKASHAGIAPEQGINSIQIAAKVIARLKLGKIDHETTANIGIISGGRATNIIPEETIVNGEVRSHDPKKLKEIQDSIIGEFHKDVIEYRENLSLFKGKVIELPIVQTEIFDDYPLMAIKSDHALAQVASDAAAELGEEMKIGVTCGGSDANVFNGKGLNTAVMGIGMQKVHSNEEYIEVKDMVFVAELVLKIIERWGAKAV